MYIFKNNQLYYEKDLNNILKSILKFIFTYERYSLYINFIDDEGYKTHIKNIYDELYNYLSFEPKLYEENYKSSSELRKYLLNNKNIKIMRMENNILI